MEKKVQDFLSTNLLNRYVIGETTPNEELMVEHFIDIYPEVTREYNQLQNNLEMVAKFEAKAAPEGVLDKILESTNQETKVIEIKKKTSKIQWYSVAASVAALIFASTSFILLKQNNHLNSENQIVIEEIFDLREDIENNNSKLKHLADQLSKLNDPDAKKYVLTGNERAKNLKTVAYINPVDKTSMIDVITLPQLPEEQYYQMWAEIQDKMVNMGTLDASERKLRPIPYLEDALALSITIENKDGKTEEEDKQVAEISLKNNK